MLPVATILSSLLGAILEHEVTSLPGWTGPLPSKHYSGYLPVGKTSGSPGFIHYWLIMSENKPETDPLVYWTNGGPGGSGINAGLLTEMGQLHLNENSLGNGSSSVPQLIYNPYNWATVANTLYVSQPKGVGFSYCEGGSHGCTNTDLSAAQDAVDFFHAFFKGYPEFKTRPLYLTAESYGGIYLPTFMQLMDADGGFPNLVGAAIGDGCWGNAVGLCAFRTGKSMQIQMQTFFGHSMISNLRWAALVKNCAPWGNDDVRKTGCVLQLAAAEEEIGRFDVYNIYDTCAGDTSQWNRKLSEWNEAMAAETIVVDDAASATAHPQLIQRKNGGALGAALNDYPCGGDRATRQWLQSDGVADALHVKAGLSGMRYHKGPDTFSGNLLPLYASLMKKYRMLIYSGDTDACVPTWGTVDWIDSLNLTVKKPWKPWSAQHLDSTGMQRAGYVKEYAHNFTFATVQGAGHLVPTYKPHFALTMISKWLAGEPLAA